MWIFLSPQMWIFLPPSWARNVQEKPRCRPHSTTAYTIGARGAKFGLIADATWSFYILVTRNNLFEREKAQIKNALFGFIYFIHLPIHQDHII